MTFTQIAERVARIYTDVYLAEEEWDKAAMTSGVPELGETVYRRHQVLHHIESALRFARRLAEDEEKQGSGS